MTETDLKCEDEIARLKTRLQKLASEKSWLQLILNLINRLSMSPGLENTVDNMLMGIVEVIGGTNVILYYFVDNNIYYADVLGKKTYIERIEDAAINEVLKKKEFVELENDYSRTLVTTNISTSAWTWVFPLKVGEEIIGICKIENLHLGTRELIHVLPTFINYAALNLKNEILGYTRLQRAYDELSKANTALHKEIAERKRYEKDLKQAKEDAETANRAKSAFLANMSHELRTPLNAILGFSQLMRTDQSCTSAQREYLDIINRSGQHLLTLINEVLDMSKIEAGRVMVEERAFDLGELVRDVTDMMRQRAESKGLQLFLNQSSSFPRFINTDAAKLRQILINLIGNDIKFTKHGSVTIRLDVQIGIDTNHLELLCEIADTGVGMSEKDLQKIFKPFVQVGEQKTQEGTGLGLAITRQFIELLGGKITVKSCVGKGSTFCFNLSVKAAQPEEISNLGLPPLSARHAVGLAPGQPLYRVLIVEDQPENRLLLKRFLESVGFITREAVNGLEALTVFEQWQPQIIFMDRRMPVMDGLESTRRIRALPGGKTVKIIALTAGAFKEDRLKVKSAGMDEFISKPFRSEEIFNCLHRLLQIEFIYEEESDDKSAQQQQKISPAQFRALPSALFDALQQAANELDIDKANLVIGEIATLDKPLAKWLLHQLKMMDFQPLLNALDEAVNTLQQAQQGK